MPIPRPSSDHRDSQPIVKHWIALRRHRLFALSALFLGPLIGFLTSGDRGLLMGLAVGGLAGFWLWWEGEPVRNEPSEQKSAK